MNASKYNWIIPIKSQLRVDLVSRRSGEKFLKYKLPGIENKTTSTTIGVRFNQGRKIDSRQIKIKL